jgi:sulfotransferase family protein
MVDYDSIKTPDDILRLAQEHSGLSEVDSDSWREGLEILLDELNTSSLVTDSGRKHLVDEYVRVLGTRLAVHDYVQHHPEVHEQAIERPLVVLGMPRTGTTVISYLLAEDPARRSLLHWECHHPVPPATTETLKTDPRCLAMVEKQRAMIKLARDAKMTMPHWEDGDGPTEDIFIHTADFKALAWESWQPTPRYSEWLINEADMSSAYAYQKIVLQVLQSNAPGVWNLKMPSHSVHINALLDAFPDARMIWAHRDPFKATGSLCNLFMLPQQVVMNADDIDRHALGRKAVAQMRAHVTNALRARDRIGDHRFFHMHYSEMMRDPMAVMQNLYAWAGDELTDDTEQRMQKWLAEHPQDLYGTNKYSLEQYGLTVDELRPVFDEYLSTFDIELEGSA